MAGSTLVAYIEGEGRLVIESPEAIQRALLQEWSGLAGSTSLVDELRVHVIPVLLGGHTLVGPGVRLVVGGTPGRAPWR